MDRRDQALPRPGPLVVLGDSQGPRPRLALALGGGAAWALAHLGVLHVLESRGIRPDLIVGTSMGAAIGAAWASGWSADAMVDRVRGIRRSDLARFSWRPRLGLFDTAPLRRTFSALVPVETIEALPIRFAAVACDLPRRREVVLASGSLVDAVQASAAVPGLLAARRYGRMLLTDGGTSANLPVRAALAFRPERVIAVRVRDEFDRIPIMPSAAYVAALERRPHVEVIRPRVQHYPMWNTRHVDAIVTAGRRAAIALSE